eukprot:jgi/Tetstr1/434754/TSEL_023806.t1
MFTLTYCRPTVGKPPARCWLLAVTATARPHSGPQSNARVRGNSLRPSFPQRHAGHCCLKQSAPRLSAAEQMEMLKRAQEASAAELQKANINPIIAGADPNAPREFRGHRTVDVRMYDQLVASRNRMSQNLSRANKYISVLEDSIEERDERISILQKEFSSVVTEIENLMRLHEKTLAAVQFSVEKEPAVEAVQRTMERMQLLQAATAAHLEALDVWVVRDVPISYSGTGSTVRIMGDFDSWTMGHLLSADSYDDSVYQTFTSTLRLTPGTYRVKFLVDEEWRTAGDWEIVKDKHGNEENLLVVK